MQRIRYIKLPFKHQHETVLHGLSHPRQAVLSDPGLGKSKSAIDVARVHIRQKEVKRVLVVAPKGAFRGWEREVGANSHYKSVVLHGPAETRFGRLKKDVRFYLINYEGLLVRGMVPRLLRKGFDMVIFDEFVRLKNHKTKTFKASRMMAEKAKFVIIMSGKPITNSAMDIFAPYLVLDGGETFGDNFFRFRNTYFRNKQYKKFGRRRVRLQPFPNWELKDKMLDKHGQEAHPLDVIKYLMYNKGIGFRKEDCLDLPPKTFKEYTCTLDKEQAEAYADASSGSEVDIGDRSIEIKHIFTRLLAQQQITSGFLYNGATEVRRGPRRLHQFGRPAKARLLREVFDDEIGSNKVVIVYRFKADRGIILSALGDGTRYVDLSGDTNVGMEAERFQRDASVDVCLAQIQAGSMAVDLFAASIMVFYSIDWRLDHYEQMTDRIHRIGQHDPCLYIHLVCEGTIDERILEAIHQKKAISDYLLEWEMQHGRNASGL